MVRVTNCDLNQENIFEVTNCDFKQKNIIWHRKLRYQRRDMVKELVIQKSIEEKILMMRGYKVMLDIDLAELYGVPTKRLNEQVKRNKKRFPKDFMFLLTWNETIGLRSQFATLKEKDHLKYRPYAFTEQGVAMLSSVLNSDRAIQVNIEIMRIFIKIRNILSEHKDLLKKIDAMEANYDRQFRIVFDIIRELNAPPAKSKKQIGFKLEE